MVLVQLLSVLLAFQGLQPASGGTVTLIRPDDAPYVVIPSERLAARFEEQLHLLEVRHVTGLSAGTPERFANYCGATERPTYVLYVQSSILSMVETRSPSRASVSVGASAYNCATKRLARTSRQLIVEVGIPTYDDPAVALSFSKLEAEVASVLARAGDR